MTTQIDVENIRKTLQQHNQSHILASWEQLNSLQKQELLTQIQQLDFSRIDEWIADFVTSPGPCPLPAAFGPAPSYPNDPADPRLQEKYAQAGQLGKELISSGRVAAFVVAGGQGSRLGFEGPKGNFPISPVKNKTFFQIFAETIAAASERYHTACTWYIMTSPLNHIDTVEIFRANRYYGLDKDSVFIFQQGTLPNFGFDGKILLADKNSIACSPDGHGGSLKALFQSGALQDMKKRGIEFISYFQVDNPLINIFDPLFIGLHALDGAQMSSKALIKAASTERVGNFCQADGRVNVIEYSDLPDELAEKRNPDGSLLFQLGSIAIHIINTSFVEKLNAGRFALPLHRAVKKIPHIDPCGNHVEPPRPNGIKLESFVFDALPMASKSVILQTLRDQEFTPVKNASGADSPETAKRMMVARAVDWLESAGVSVPKRDDGAPDCLIEIAPAFALEKGDIKQKLDRIPNIRPGDKLYLA
ncbi:MAG: UTP--glucose-1-phosphate uridylyltransferase [Planctomycetota bacterium]|jgi:UDP-N-acetylglucosamine/UDP-N-acetylgalactosamine diphosphorylase